MKKLKVIVRDTTDGRTLDEQNFSSHKPFLGFFTKLKKKGWKIVDEETVSTVWVEQNDLFSGGN